MIGSTHTCLNCGNVFNGNYCNNCGQQKLDEKEFTMKGFVHNAIGESLEVDDRLLKTIKLLLFKPGFLVSEYFRGKFQSYWSPVKLYLICSLLYFVVFHFFPDHDFYHHESLYKQDATGLMKKIADNAIAERHINEEQLTERFADFASYSMYIVVFFYAILFSIIYFYKKMNFVHHFVFSLYLMCFIMLKDVLLFPLYYVIPAFEPRLALNIFIICVYSVFSMKEYYKITLAGAIIRVSIFTVLFWGVSFLLTYLALIITIYTF
ncbi:MAG TPA: DUF3667 domain-containing protein [Cytophagaceae bacterium]|jgi:hypothetical protein|nr:DUF3667 domain-containing protein [Cytophagaceae bacterium]